MKSIFTIHAGEYLVGEYLEKKYKKYNIWIPSKDTGIDLLVTNADNSKSVSLQVKYSKDFLITEGREYQEKLYAVGWWTLNADKIRKSKADYWVFVFHNLNKRKMQYLLISPKELLKKLKAIHPKKKTIQTYLTVTKDMKCWETRGLKKEDLILIAYGSYKNKTRDFTKYLNVWDKALKELKKTGRGT